MKIRVLTDPDPEVLRRAAELSGADPYSISAAYETLGIDRSREVPIRLSAALSGPSALAAVVESRGRIVGLIGCQPDRAVSEHFSVRAATLGPLLVDPAENRKGVTQVLVGAVQRLLRDRGVSFTSLRAHSDDLLALAALQSAGFRVADTMVTYALRPVSQDGQLQTRRRLGELDISISEGQGILQLGRTTADVFAEYISQNYRLSRFHADPAFNADLASSFYVAWCRRAFSGTWADGIVLAQRGSEPVGFISGTVDRLATRLSGTKVYGTGLAASLGSSAYSRMVEFMRLTAFYDIAEFDVHVANLPVQSSVNRHGHPHTLRATHALHSWLDV